MPVLLAISLGAGFVDHFFPDALHDSEVRQVIAEGSGFERYEKCGSRFSR